MPDPNYWGNSRDWKEKNVTPPDSSSKPDSQTDTGAKEQNQDFVKQDSVPKKAVSAPAGAYFRMLENLKSKEAHEQKNQEETSSVPRPSEPKLKEKSTERIMGKGNKYKENILNAHKKVKDGSASLYLIFAPKSWKNIECVKAGKNREGDPIFEVIEDNVTLGFSDHEISVR